MSHKITKVEDQSASYAAAELKWVKNTEPLPFVYESTGVITRFTDGRDPKPRSREVFTFHRTETMHGAAFLHFPRIAASSARRASSTASRAGSASPSGSAARRSLKISSMSCRCSG